jgi:hypothetical protein
MHQRLTERFYGDEFEVSRGIRKFGSAQVGVAAITQLTSDEETITFSENKFANYSPIEGVTSNFEEGFEITRNVSPDDIVHFNDMTNENMAAFKTEAEIAPATGETQVDHDQLGVSYETGANPERFFGGDPNEMNRPELRAWMQTIDRIEEEQTKQENMGDTDTADTDFYEKIGEGSSPKDIQRLQEIVDTARDEPGVSVPDSVNEVMFNIFM